MEELLAGMLLVVLWDSVWCQSATDAKNLNTHLFNTYDNRIRPRVEQSLPTSVYADLYLLSIHELDEVSGTLKTKGYLKLSWTDEFLTWDPNNFGGLTETFIPQDNVWRPDVTLKNSNDNFEELGHKTLRVRVTNNGTVHWSPFQLFESTCPIDITHFPFDQQTCMMAFETWSYPGRQARMLIGKLGGVSLEWYSESSTWDLTSATAFLDREFAIVFQLTLDRKPLNNLLMFVVPVLLLAILNLFVFALPSDSGEKSGFAVTVFLAFTVFMTIVASSFPENSETIAYLSIYVVIQTIQSTLITIIALLMIRLAAVDNSAKVPGWIITIARLSRCRVAREKANSKRIEPEPNTGIGQVSELTTDTNIEYTWLSVVNALDRLFFVLFLLSFFTSTLVCILSAKYHF